MKRLLFYMLLAFIPLAVPAQDHQVTRKPTNPQQTTSKPTRKPSSKQATKPVGKPAQNPQSQPKTTSRRNPNATLCPDGNHPHAIDLGLPSGTKWACCNVGATTPDGYGGYYAWGETRTKSDYSEATSKYYMKSKGNICGTPDDVAYVKWGSNWRMPSKDDIVELRSNCQKFVITINGVKGMKLTGKNGKSIFFPFAGFRRGKRVSYRNQNGFIWSGTHGHDNDDAFLLDVYDDGRAECYSSYRNRGKNVRPVKR